MKSQERIAPEKAITMFQLYLGGLDVTPADIGKELLERCGLPNRTDKDLKDEEANNVINEVCREIAIIASSAASIMRMQDRRRLTGNFGGAFIKSSATIKRM